MNVTWSAPEGHVTSDWLGLYRVGAADAEPYASAYVETEATTGQISLELPDEIGELEFRYFVSNTYTRAATSPSFTTHLME